MKLSGMIWIGWADLCVGVLSPLRSSHWTSLFRLVKESLVSLAKDKSRKTEATTSEIREKCSSQLQLERDIVMPGVERSCLSSVSSHWVGGSSSQAENDTGGSHSAWFLLLTMLFSAFWKKTMHQSIPKGGVLAVRLLIGPLCPG